MNYHKLWHLGECLIISWLAFCWGRFFSFSNRWFLGQSLYSHNRWDSPYFIWRLQFSDIQGQCGQWKKYSQMYSWVQKAHLVPDPTLSTSAFAVTTNFVLPSQLFTRTGQARGSANTKCKLTDGPHAPSALWLSRLSFTSCRATFPCVTVPRTPGGRRPRMPCILHVWHPSGKH